MKLTDEQHLKLLGEILLPIDHYLPRRILAYQHPDGWDDEDAQVLEALFYGRILAAMENYPTLSPEDLTAYFKTYPTFKVDHYRAWLREKGVLDETD